MKSKTYEGANVAKEYDLTLDMAKELSMVENNERGRLRGARRTSGQTIGSRSKPPEDSSNFWRKPSTREFPVMGKIKELAMAA